MTKLLSYLSENTAEICLHHFHGSSFPNDKELLSKNCQRNISKEKKHLHTFWSSNTC